MPAEDRGQELLLRELGRINSELATHRRSSAMTAHDLSSPAQVILGLGELLLEHQNLDPVVRRRLEQLHRSAVTMTAMISDLGHGLALDDQASLERQRVNLVELVTSVVERTRVLADAKVMELRLRAQPADQHGCWVDGDPVMLERALTNLLGNALKFSPPRSTVSVALDRSPAHVTLAVSDEGPGISEEGRSRIFEVFHREERAAHLPGLGLGLAITKQIVESHGGTISVDSESGQGATFVVQLPRVTDERLADPA